MHITILALGSRGDIQPYAVLGHGLQAAGHRVRFITFESFASLISEQKLDFHPIRGDAQALVASAGTNMLAMVRSFGALAAGYARDLSAPSLGETDLILNQLPLGLYGFDLAETYCIPMMLAAVIPLVRTRAFPLMGVPKLHFPGYNRATYLVAERLVWLMFRRVINRWRAQTLLLPPLPLTGYFDRLGTQHMPILNGFSPHVIPRPADWNEHVHTTGYWFPEHTHWQPSAELRAFLAAGPPPIFIGFGSMPLNDPQTTTNMILAALKQTEQRGILHSGWGGLGNQALPDYVLKIDYAAYNWLFPRMAMVIHHGGSGTTSFALRSGVPSCVVACMFDQFFWGERTAELGAGPRPMRYTQLTVARLREAIQLGVAHPEIRRQASAVGEKLRSERGIATARRIIEQFVATEHAA